MGRKGNSGYTNPDKRFGFLIDNYSGSLGLTQHYLERLDGDISPELMPASGYTAWYRSDSGIVLDGSGKVEQWNDLSGNNLNLTQADADQRGDYETSNIYLNNLPTVDLQSVSGDYLAGADSTLLQAVSSNGGFTAYLVLKQNNYRSYGFIMARTDGDNWKRGWGVYYQSGTWRFYINDWNSNSTRVELTPTSQTSIPLIFKFVYNDSTNGDGSGILAQIIANTNSRSGTKTSMTSVMSNANITDGLRLNWGGNTSPSSFSWQGDADYGEFIFYNAPLSSEGQSITEYYLKKRYNITPG